MKTANLIAKWGASLSFPPRVRTPEGGTLGSTSGDPWKGKQGGPDCWMIGVPNDYVFRIFYSCVSTDEGDQTTDKDSRIY